MGTVFYFFDHHGPLDPRHGPPVKNIYLNWLFRFHMFFIYLSIESQM